MELLAFQAGILLLSYTVTSEGAKDQICNIRNPLAPDSKRFQYGPLNTFALICKS